MCASVITLIFEHLLLDRVFGGGGGEGQDVGEEGGSGRGYANLCFSTTVFFLTSWTQTRKILCDSLSHTEKILSVLQYELL